MSERKVLNKYYPPDFDPSKIPRVKGSKNRQFTVRLMAPCNMKCYTCGEYIAKGKKFNARKEDVDDMNFLGIRIYRFYIRCPGCISEISFRTDPASTDYVLEAGAHRNFQALKLAEEQAAREAKEAQDEIESNPMLLLENRTQQSQYEMDLLETLEDLRDQNDRHASIDLSAVAGKYQKERELSADQIEEQERMEAYIALGYEMIEGKLVKRLKDEDLNDELPVKKIKVEGSSGSDFLTGGKPMDPKKYQNSLKAKLNGLVRKKPQSSVATSCVKTEPLASGTAHNNTISIPDPDRIKMPPPTRIRRLVQNHVSKDPSSLASRASASSSSSLVPNPDVCLNKDEDLTAVSDPATDGTHGCGVQTSPPEIPSGAPDETLGSPSSSEASKSSISCASSLSLLGQYSDSSSGSDED